MLILFETTDSALVEIDTGRQRLHAVREVLIVDLHSGDVRDQTTEDLEVQRVPLSLPASQLRLARGRFPRPSCLSIECLDNRRRIEEQLQ